MLQLLNSLLLVALASSSDHLSHSPISHTVSGEDAVPHSKPWQTLLQYEMNGGWFFICGGTLINLDWVLTAAHCISSSRTYQVVLGEYDRTVREGPEQFINVTDIFVHPRWNSSCVACGNDLALLKLSHSAELTLQVQPACLPPAGCILPHGTECLISGWGSTYTGGPLPDKLQKGQLPMVNYTYCSQPDWWGSTVKETMVCAGGDEVSACNGDSGGPLTCRGVNAEWEVHGVTSFVSGFGCNTEKKPTVFTRVSAFIDWIEETIANN
ncbi:chymotrypsin-like elastase family member 3B [Ochotona curzoniae]|uniref:chymotrypsin-like elastase family member 3B n=1 Tax=Ochotona curzoniae TaxID=130825 RepID=UPI001B3467CF|nr:chymotrypsin-like elastase family member 3B [Ochotona curzoniae]